MQILWELKHGFLKDIMDKMPEPKAHSNTVATILKILIEKGFVNYEVQGRNNLYKPAVSKSEYGKKSINQLVKGYFEGSPAKLLSHFVNENKLSQEELEALLEQIKNAKNHNQ
ncbi:MULTISPECIES: BlaI/MecI/CopY family transcriptional regulator [Niastella]